MPELTVAAQADGRLVLFALRPRLDGSQGVEMLEMLRQTIHGEWLPLNSSPQPSRNPQPAA